MIDVFNTKSGDLVRFIAGNTHGYDLEEALQHGLVEGKRLHRKFYCYRKQKYKSLLARF